MHCLTFSNSYPSLHVLLFRASHWIVNYCLLSLYCCGKKCKQRANRKKAPPMSQKWLCKFAPFTLRREFMFFLNVTFCVQKGQIDSRKNCKQLKNYVQILRLIVNVQCEICPPKFWTEAICLCIFILLKLLGIEKFATIIFFTAFMATALYIFMATLSCRHERHACL